MKRLLSPAITLMNRLKMVYKFSLISILFLLPISALSYLLVSQLNASIHSIQAEVDGLKVLKEVNRLDPGRHCIPGLPLGLQAQERCETGHEDR